MQCNSTIYNPCVVVKILTHRLPQQDTFSCNKVMMVLHVTSLRVCY